MRHFIPLILSLVLGLLFQPAPVLAEGACNPTPASPVVLDLQTAVGTQGSSAQDYTLPSGTLTADDLEKAFESLLDKGAGVASLFGMLADGQSRVLPGDVVRDLFKKYGVSIDFLPVDTLKEVVAENGKVTFKFDFNGEETRDVKLPDGTVTFLKSKNKNDPTLVDGKNQVKTKKSEGRSLRVRNEVQLLVNEAGITGIRAGDVKVAALGWRDVALRTEHNPGKTAMEDDYAVLQTDASGKPVVKDNHYQVQTYDDWVVMEVQAFGTRRVDIGVPPLTR